VNPVLPRVTFATPFGIAMPSSVTSRTSSSPERTCAASRSRAAASAMGEAPVSAQGAGASLQPAAGGGKAMEFAAPAASDTSFDARLDEDLALTPPEVKAKSPADILAGASSELAKSARSAAAAAAGAAAAGGIAAREAPATIGERIEAARSGADLDFHLDESAPAPRRTTTSAEQPARPDQPTGVDGLDLSFDRGESAPEDATPSVLDGQWHDAATKLDLAKAELMKVEAVCGTTCEQYQDLAKAIAGKPEQS